MTMQRNKHHDDEERHRIKEKLQRLSRKKAPPDFDLHLKRRIHHSRSPWRKERRVWGMNYVHVVSTMALLAVAVVGYFIVITPDFGTQHSVSDGNQRDTIETASRQEIGRNGLDNNTPSENGLPEVKEDSRSGEIVRTQTSGTVTDFRAMMTDSGKTSHTLEDMTIPSTVAISGGKRRSKSGVVPDTTVDSMKAKTNIDSTRLHR